MSLKTWVTIGLVVGSTIGGFVPGFWGDSSLSVTSGFFSILGGLAGAWVGVMISRSLE